MKAPNISFHSELSLTTVIHEMVGKEAVEAVEIDMDQRTVALIYPHGDMLEMAKLFAASVKMAEALLPFAEKPTEKMDSYPCHNGICPKERCGRCGRAIAAYHALLEAGYTD